MVSCLVVKRHPVPKDAVEKSWTRGRRPETVGTRVPSSVRRGNQSNTDSKRLSLATDHGSSTERTPPAQSPPATAGYFVAAAAHFSSCWRHSHGDRLHIKGDRIQRRPCGARLGGGGCLNQNRAENVVVFTSEYQKIEILFIQLQIFRFCFVLFFRTLITLKMSSAFQAVGCRWFFRRNLNAPRRRLLAGDDAVGPRLRPHFLLRDGSSGGGSLNSNFLSA